LLEIFLELAAQGVSILFSTHITSDLEKCADAITYIQKGRIIASRRTEDFAAQYRLVKAAGEVTAAQRELALGIRRSKEGQTMLIPAGQESRARELFADKAAEIVPADLETIMVHLEGNA
ncbi:MAG: ABC transporter ATP-binding protein, partial [Acetatifactor sp.]|nr:ABC transporter ATP-binding protein [Acetatifactor sp.]